MTYRGKVRNGVIVLEDAAAADLAEGTEVHVQAVRIPELQNWAEVLKDVIGTAQRLPSASSLKHDHYLYGSEKK